MIAEPLLNAVLHLLALQAASLPEPARAEARERVLAYLHDHVGLTHADTYIGLFDDLAAVHAGAPGEAILDQAATMSGRLKALLHGAERNAGILPFFEVAALAPTAPLPLRLAQAVGETLGFSPESLRDILEFAADPVAFSRAGASSRQVGGGPGQAFRGTVAVLRLEAEDLTLVAPVGEQTVRLEGRVLRRGRCPPCGRARRRAASRRPASACRPIPP